MSEFKFFGTIIDDKGNKLTSTFYVYGDTEKEAVNRFLGEYKPLPFQWEFLGRV